MKRIFLTLALLTLPPAALADVQDLAPGDNDPLAALYGEEEVVSIATGSEKQVHRAPSVATVITAQEIRESGARTLDQVLEQVPGLHVAPSNFSRLDSVYSVRGIHTSFNPQVLVLMNGVPFPHLYSGGRPVTFSLPVENIARVEVIRGPGSAVYGADAFAGVVNIITKGPEQMKGTTTGMRYGSFDSTEAWFQHGGELGAFKVALSLEWMKSNGDTGRVVDYDLQSFFDGLLGTSASYAPGPLETGYNILNAHLELDKERWTLRTWGWLQDDAGMGPGGAQALDPVGKQDVQLWLGDLTWRDKQLLPDLDATVRFNYFYSKDDSSFQLFPMDYPFDGVTSVSGTTIANPLSYDQQTNVEVTGLYSGFADHHVRTSIGHKYSHEDTEEYKNFGDGVTTGEVTDFTGTQYVYMEPHSRQVYFLSLQDEWAFAQDWELTAGVRLDQYSDFGTTINPRAALVWATRHDLTTKLMYGRAFRAPSFAELYAINNPVMMGNPDLEPEIINTYELAFDYRPTLKLRTSASLFHYEIAGLIDYVADASGTTSTAQNVNDQNGHGFELEAEWKATDTLKVLGNLAWNRAVNDDTGERIPYAPAKQFYVSAHWEFEPDWSLHPRINWVMDRAREPGDTREEIDNYVLVDLALRRKNVARNWEFALLLQNLFDQDAREPSTISSSIPGDYPLEGFGVFGEVRYNFDP